MRWDNKSCSVMFIPNCEYLIVMIQLKFRLLSSVLPVLFLSFVSPPFHCKTARSLQTN